MFTENGTPISFLHIKYNNENSANINLRPYLNLNIGDNNGLYIKNSIIYDFGIYEGKDNDNMLNNKLNKKPILEEPTNLNNNKILTEETNEKIDAEKKSLSKKKFLNKKKRRYRFFKKGTSLGRGIIKNKINKNEKSLNINCLEGKNNLKEKNIEVNLENKTNKISNEIKNKNQNNNDINNNKKIIVEKESNLYGGEQYLETEINRDYINQNKKNYKLLINILNQLINIEKNNHNKNSNNSATNLDKQKTKIDKNEKYKNESSKNEIKNINQIKENEVEKENKKEESSETKDISNNINKMKVERQSNKKDNKEIINQTKNDNSKENNEIKKDEKENNKIKQKLNKKKSNGKSISNSKENVLNTSYNNMKNSPKNNSNINENNKIKTESSEKKEIKKVNNSNINKQKKLKKINKETLNSNKDVAENNLKTLNKILNEKNVKNKEGKNMEQTSIQENNEKINNIETLKYGNINDYFKEIIEINKKLENINVKGKNILFIYYNLRAGVFEIYNYIMNSDKFEKFTNYIIYYDKVSIIVYLEFNVQIDKKRYLLRNHYEINHVKPFIYANFDYKLLLKLRIPDVLIKTNIEIIQKTIEEQAFNKIIEIRVKHRPVKEFKYIKNILKNEAFNKTDYNLNEITTNLQIERKGIWLKSKIDIPDTVIKEIFENNIYVQKLFGNFKNYNDEDIIMIKLTEQPDKTVIRKIIKYLYNFTYAVNNNNTRIIPIYSKIIIISEYSFENFFINYPRIYDKLKNKFTCLKMVKHKNKNKNELFILFE